jgi:bifunctional aspartokinase / homoserine dehydrogenase 1
MGETAHAGSPVESTARLDGASEGAAILGVVPCPDVHSGAASLADCGDNTTVSGVLPIHSSWRPLVRTRHSHSHLKALAVMKFGGTSLADAECVRKVADIVQGSLQEQSVVVVVSAMAGVTDLLVEAGTCAEVGEWGSVSRIFETLRERHTAAANALIRSDSGKAEFEKSMQGLLVEGERVCREVGNAGALTAQMLDIVLSLGERLSVRLVASALMECGVASEAIDANECLVTDTRYGAANPLHELTRERCESRLRPLLRRGVVPVVTGFLGATVDGAITTLGRGGSDYSASIIGAALDSQEVVIWTDVDGFLTADPRLVCEARTIPEISYQQAAALAYFGAKVLHPKTLQPVIQRGIPVWIRNTFDPERRGTKITLEGPHADAGVKALTGIRDISLITLTIGNAEQSASVMRRTCAALAGAHVDMILVVRTHAADQIGLSVRSTIAIRAMDILRREFDSEDHGKCAPQINLKNEMSLVTVVGQHLRGLPMMAEQAAAALHEQELHALASTESASDCTVSFVVPTEVMQTTLRTLHKQLHLDR